jgi:signal transduction histidine kinase
MRKLLTILFLTFSFISHSQFTQIKEQNIEATWDQGIPYLPEDEYISDLTNQLTYDSLLLRNKHTDENSVKLCREIGIAFYNKGMYDAADWYLSRVKDYESNIEIDVIQRKKMLDEIKDKKQEIDFSESQIESLKNDAKILEGLPESYESLSVNDLRNMVKKIDGQIKRLTKERDSLSKHEGNEGIVKLKDGTIKTLEKEKEVIELNIDKTELKEDKKILGLEKEKLKTYLTWLGVVVSVLVLVVLVLSQRKTIKVQDDEIESQLKDINKKNTYLEHAARFIRHDMHSGINTYIPRGINSLEKRLTVDDIKNLKIEGSLKMIREGLNHTQKVYKNVYEFTNLVKQNSVLDKNKVNLSTLLNNYVKTTSYTSQVEIGELVDVEVNEILFCNAIDNLIKNGLQYNESQTKLVKVFMENGYLVLQDNGVGMTQEQFDKICKTYNKKENKDIDKDTYGLGLNICLAILNEHGFDLSCEKNEVGTKMKIKIN